MRVWSARKTPIPGEVRFEPRATLPTLGGPDISVTTDTRLKIKFVGAVPLPVVVSNIAIPIGSLLTILRGFECRVRRLNVSTPTGKSADVHGHIVDIGAARDAAGSLLTTLGSRAATGRAGDAPRYIFRRQIRPAGLRGPERGPWHPLATPPGIHRAGLRFLLDL